MSSLPTIGEIDKAITTRNRKQASTMLQTLIKEKPSADAWFLASQLTQDRTTKIRYLHNAILLDSNHRKSLRQLETLGEAVHPKQNMLLRTLVHELRLQADSSPFLRHFSPPVQAIIGLGIMVGLVVILGVLVSTLMPAANPALSSDGPTVRATEFVTTSDIQNTFENSSLDILFSQMQRDTVIGKDILQFDIRDEGNRSRLVEVFVYDSVQAIIDDQSILAIYDEATQVQAHSNIIVVYPLDLSETSTTTITGLVNSLAQGGA